MGGQRHVQAASGVSGFTHFSDFIAGITSQWQLTCTYEGLQTQPLGIFWCSLKTFLLSSYSTLSISSLYFFCGDIGTDCPYKFSSPPFPSILAASLCLKFEQRDQGLNGYRDQITSNNLFSSPALHIQPADLEIPLECFWYLLCSHRTTGLWFPCC